MKELRNTLLLNASTCPTCGIMVPDELDHHLPKSVYKSLAIYSRNLVAYCHKCNNKKRTVDGIDPNERFIHPYFSKLPVNEQFLFADVSLVNNALSISLRIEQINGISDLILTQMEFQMNRVNLKRRLVKTLNVHLSSIAGYIERDYQIGGHLAVAEGIRFNAKAQKKIFGLNHWRYAILIALANCQDFCDGGFYNSLGLTK